MLGALPLATANFKSCVCNFTLDELGGAVHDEGLNKQHPMQCRSGGGCSACHLKICRTREDYATLDDMISDKSTDSTSGR
jgi:ferredoxin